MIETENQVCVVNLEYSFARMAVDKAKLCPVDATRSNPAPRVAIILELNGIVLGWAAKGYGGSIRNADGTDLAFQVKASEHAEKALLDNLADIDLAGATAYVTLEPCAKRRRGESCANLLITRKISVVHIANCDPNPDVGALAWKIFHRHNVTVRDFPGDLRNEARRDNSAFFSKFQCSTKMYDGGAFDYNSNGGIRLMGLPGREFKTSWTNRGNGTIYALDYARNVCLAKNCTEFSQIDDPGRWLEDSHYTKPVNEGEIVIFQNEYGFALVKVMHVSTRTSTTNAELQFEFELRYR
ncbi:hypothetical protein LOY64_29840 [Pseudomonas corrugata]|jgi:pyrimidine deaminase RibD-like protein|uniref:CMP/dCMP-type deaminase domain-containing protein n=1 Tax=Pseudomonas corrugata TaxID=47879 RepID=A0A8B6UQY3_9PSED|nr:hypothetical protein [Pseudomonas corrugata]MDU9024549.1 hypothetical protein [Pseudomonas corrugata]MDU9035089.1 hypothetical protein [Pseudomonas corrugata]QTH14310.1 hypothetical protein C4C32_27900 [Pseudomonas corrugata]UZD95408.1 hypothetical protein LOY64_29840 [Pseudomonas corrugata]